MSVESSGQKTLLNTANATMNSRELLLGLQAGTEWERVSSLLFPEEKGVAESNVSTAAPQGIAAMTQPAQTAADFVSASSSGKVMIITLSMFVAIVVPTCSGV